MIGSLHGVAFPQSAQRTVAWQQHAHAQPGSAMVHSMQEQPSEPQFDGWLHGTGAVAMNMYTLHEQAGLPVV